MECELGVVQVQDLPLPSATAMLATVPDTVPDARAGLVAHEPAEDAVARDEGSQVDRVVVGPFLQRGDGCTGLLSWSSRSRFSSKTDGG